MNRLFKQNSFVAARLFLFLLFFPLYAEKTPFIDNALKMNTPAESISYIAANVESINNIEEKKQTLLFMANLQKQTGLFLDAYSSYSKIIQLEKNEPNSDIRLQAACCAMAAGELEIAENVLDSIISINDTNSAFAKFMAVWCGVLKAENVQTLAKPIALFKSFLTDNTMHSTKVSVLFSLWWLTNEPDWAVQLQAEFPSSPETALINGKSHILPASYYLFLPRKNNEFPISYDSEKDKNTSEYTKTAQKKDSTKDKLSWQQVGFFKSEANAQNCVKKLKAAGFEGTIRTETRPSGTVYYAVLVRETDGSVGQNLKNSGFECYPVFE